MSTSSGLIAIVGKPNVGKSTLLNHILGRKVSITSRKSQTTRNNITGIKTLEKHQMVFIDTPGIHTTSKKTLNKILNRSANMTIEDADVILFLVQRDSINELDIKIMHSLQTVKSPVICVINKLDQVSSKDKLLPLIKQLKDHLNFVEIIPVSAKTGQKVGELESLICQYLPQNPFFYSEKDIVQISENFYVAEIVREKIIRCLGDELPHETFVQVSKIDKTQKTIGVFVEIFVAKQSQKGIVVGKGGATLKKIGQQARIDLEEFFGQKVFLESWVKVKKNWNNDQNFIASLGIGSS